MTKKVYNKLVRDNVIKNMTDKTVVLKILNDAEYLTALRAKLIEEANELNAAIDDEIEIKIIEEIADVQEVINAIVSYFDYESRHIDSVRLDKAESNGTFKNKLFLIEVNNL